jgi:chromosome segregation ATPase
MSEPERPNRALRCEGDVLVFKEIWEKTTQAESGVESLKERLNILDNRVQNIEERKADISALSEATRLAKENVDARLVAMNEFREQMGDQANTFFTRSEHDAYVHSVDDRWVKLDENIRDLRESRATEQGKASQTSVLIAYAIGIVGIILSVIAIVWHDAG